MRGEKNKRKKKQKEGKPRSAVQEAMYRERTLKNLKVKVLDLYHGMVERQLKQSQRALKQEKVELTV